MKSWSIGEVARLLGVKPHVIRYWESELPLAVPPERADGKARILQPRDRAAPEGPPPAAREEIHGGRGAPGHVGGAGGRRCRQARPALRDPRGAGRRAHDHARAPGCRGGFHGGRHPTTVRVTRPGTPLRALGGEARRDERPAAPGPAGPGPRPARRVAGPAPRRPAAARHRLRSRAVRAALREQGGRGGPVDRGGGDPPRQDGVPHRRGRAGLAAGIRRPQGHVSRQPPPRAHPVRPAGREAARRAEVVRHPAPLAHHDQRAEPGRTPRSISRKRASSALAGSLSASSPRPCCPP